MILRTHPDGSTTRLDYASLALLLVGAGCLPFTVHGAATGLMADTISLSVGALMLAPSLLAIWIGVRHLTKIEVAHIPVGTTSAETLYHEIAAATRQAAAHDFGTLTGSERALSVANAVRRRTGWPVERIEWDPSLAAAGTPLPHAVNVLPDGRRFDGVRAAAGLDPLTDQHGR